MNPTLQFVFAGLAAFRITRLLTADTILDTPRDWAKTHLGSFIATLITCSWCLGAWISAGTVLLLDRYAFVPLPVLQAFAISAVVGLLSHWSDN